MLSPATAPHFTPSDIISKSRYHDPGQKQCPSRHNQRRCGQHWWPGNNIMGHKQHQVQSWLTRGSSCRSIAFHDFFFQLLARQQQRWHAYEENTCVARRDWMRSDDGRKLVNTLLTIYFRKDRCRWLGHITGLPENSLPQIGWSRHRTRTKQPAPHNNRGDMSVKKQNFCLTEETG